MSSLRPGFAEPQSAISLQIPTDRSRITDGEPRRAVSLMRKFDVAALLPDLSIACSSHVAPATALFEDACSAFARGTLIPTVRGPVAIEDLLPGDYVETTHGAQPVTWIGSTSYIPGRPADEGTTLTGLTRITSDAFGLGKPSMDILVGPGARLVVRHARLKTLIGQEAVLAPVADYADGDRFLPVTPGGAVQLYHFMASRHTTLLIGGVEVETYHPGKAVTQLTGKNQRALFLSFFPNIAQLEDFGQVSMTRTTREVVESLIDT